MFIALRRFTLVCTIVLERFILNKVHDKATVGAVLIMVGGASSPFWPLFWCELRQTWVEDWNGR